MKVRQLSSKTIQTTNGCGTQITCVRSNAWRVCVRINMLTRSHHRARVSAVSLNLTSHVLNPALRV